MSNIIGVCRFVAEILTLAGNFIEKEGESLSHVVHSILKVFHDTYGGEGLWSLNDSVFRENYDDAYEELQPLYQEHDLKTVGKLFEFFGLITPKHQTLPRQFLMYAYFESLLRGKSFDDCLCTTRKKSSEISKVF